MMFIHVPGHRYVYECVPLLKNLAGFRFNIFSIYSVYSVYKYVPSGDDGDDDNRSDKAGGKSNSILTQFIKHMNKATLNTVMIAIINTIVMLTQDFANLPVCHKNI